MRRGNRMTRAWRTAGMREPGFPAWLRRLSVSGAIFASLFTSLFVFCLVWALQGEGFALIPVFILTLPFSLAVLVLSGGLQHVLGFSDEALNWAVFILSGVAGVFEFYFLGWFMEKPFRR